MQSTASRISGQKRATPADGATEAEWRLRSAYPQEGWRGKESQRPARKQARKVFALPIALPLYAYRLPWVGFDSRTAMTSTALSCLDQGDSGHINDVTSRANRQMHGCSSRFKTPYPLRIRSSFFRKKKQNRVPRVPEPCRNLLLQKNECKCFVNFLQDIFFEKMHCAERIRSLYRFSNLRMVASSVPPSFLGAGMAPVW